MNRKSSCPACNAQNRGIKSRISYPHTCGIEKGFFPKKQEIAIPKKTIEELKARHWAKSNETLNACKCTCTNSLQYSNCGKICERFNEENEEMYFQPMQMLRELAMRTQIALPENEEDLKYFEEGFNSDFGKKLLHILDLGKFEVEK